MEYCNNCDLNVDTDYNAEHFDDSVECHEAMHGKDLTELRPLFDEEGSYGFYCTSCKKFVGDTQEATSLAIDQMAEEAALTSWLQAGGW